MSVVADSPRVLVIGLDPHRVPGPWDPDPVDRGIEQGRAEFGKHQVIAEFCLVALDGSDDVPAVIATALSREPWGCVVIGGGVRYYEELFEQVVNLARQHAPGAAIAFSSTPADTYAAAARWLTTPE